MKAQLLGLIRVGLVHNAILQCTRCATATGSLPNPPLGWISSWLCTHHTLVLWPSQSSNTSLRRFFALKRTGGYGHRQVRLSSVLPAGSLHKDKKSQLQEAAKRSSYKKQLQEASTRSSYKKARVSSKEYSTHNNSLEFSVQSPQHLAGCCLGYNHQHLHDFY